MTGWPSRRRRSEAHGDRHGARERVPVRVLDRRHRRRPDGRDLRPGADGAARQGPVPLHRPRDRRAVAGRLPLDVSGHGAHAPVRRARGRHPRVRPSRAAGLQPHRALRRRPRRRGPAHRLLPAGERDADEPGEGPAGRLVAAHAVQPQRRLHRARGARLPAHGRRVPVPGAGVRRDDRRGAGPALAARARASPRRSSPWSWSRRSRARIAATPSRSPSSPSSG